jgi:hypothetical protein
MIKKTTKAIFKENGEERVEDLVGGIPLSIGETMTIKNGNDSKEWKVVDKKIVYANDGEDQLVEVTYTFE